MLQAPLFLNAFTNWIKYFEQEANEGSNERQASVEVR